MVFNKKQENSLEREIEIRFALFPTRINEEQILWLERYYFYQNDPLFYNNDIYMGRYKDFKNKKSFFKKVVLKEEG